MPLGVQSIGENLKLAIDQLADAGFALRATSGLWHTPAVPAGSGPDYANAVVLAGWRGGARAALDALHRIEAGMGRTRTARWGPRTLDLDLLALDDSVLPDLAGWTHWATLPAERQRVEMPDRLILPHPRLQDRAFVLLPLAEIAPDWRHPVTGRDVARMLADLPPGARDGMVRRGDLTG